MRIPLAITEIAGIVLLRFPPLVRLWALIVVAVNAMAILFIDTRFGQVALAAVGLGLVIMAFIYMKLGFVRLLGVGHVLWIPMLPWLAIEAQSVDPGTWLQRWMVTLIGINALCLVVDVVDVVRFVAGERAPYYSWNPGNRTR